MPQDEHGPSPPRPAPGAEPEARSIADNVREVMLGIGEIGMAIGGDGSRPYESTGDMKPARTWYGSILQWAWALAIFLVGLAVLAIFLLVGIGWIMDLFS